jgi:uncharacterized protein (TIGR03118 family)
MRVNSQERGGWSKRLAMALGAVAAAAAAVAPGAGAAGAGEYTQTNLVSDQAGKAQLHDPDLVNAWGLAFGPATPAWVANNHSNNSTLYSGGVGMSPVMKIPLTVAIPGGAPTGAVFNGSSSFMIGKGMNAAPALFIFDSEAGRITAWNQMLPHANKAQTVATVKNAIFKGLAIASTKGGPRIYATDFHHGRVDVWDGSFARVHSKGAFRDPKLPKRYAPFGIEAVKGKIFVTYAKQDKDAEDDSPGAHRGFIDVYTPAGKLVRRFASHGPLNSPWGIALAPHGFGPASGDLLVGNFGNGAINAYDATSGKLVGGLESTSGQKLKIDGLWALEFGNGVIGTPKTLLFTAGPNDETHGLFGELTPH